MTAWTNPATGKTTAIPDGWVPQAGSAGFFINGPRWAILGSEPAQGQTLLAYSASFLSERTHRFTHAHTESADGVTAFIIGATTDHGMAETFVIRRIGHQFWSIDFQDSSTRQPARCDDPALSAALFSTGGAD